MAHESLTNQMDWAQAEASRSRENINVQRLMTTDSEQDVRSQTMEEEALGSLFEAHSALAEGIRQHDELERMAQDEAELRQARDRSRKDTRMDRNVSHLSLSTARIILMNRSYSCHRSGDLDQDHPLRHLTLASPILVQSMEGCLNPDIHRIKADHAHPHLNFSLIRKCRLHPPGRLRHYRKQRAHDHYLILRSAPICLTLLSILMYRSKVRSRGMKTSTSPSSQVGKLLGNAEQSSMRTVRPLQLTYE